MKFFTATTPAEQFIGMYGNATVRDEEGYLHVVGRTGLLIDHTDLFVVAGGTVVVGKHSVWAVLPNGQACPVVCGQIIRIDTEDGPSDGRCGLNIVIGQGACEMHVEETNGWLDMDESERAHWERSRDEMGF